jgi:hypothetical protein
VFCKVVLSAARSKRKQTAFDVDQSAALKSLEFIDDEGRIFDANKPWDCNRTAPTGTSPSTFGPVLWTLSLVQRLVSAIAKASP